MSTFPSGPINFVKAEAFSLLSTTVSPGPKLSLQPLNDIEQRNGVFMIPEVVACTE